MKKNTASHVHWKIKLKSFLKSPGKFSILIGIFFFSLYLSTAPKVNVSYADSDLMLVIGSHLGVAHPPGYPIYMLLIFLFTHLPIAGTIAFRGHVLSALLHSLTLVLLFLAIVEIIKYLNKKVRINFQEIMVAFASVSTLGLSFLFWTYSSVAEKYALNDFFASLIVLISLKLALNTKCNRKLWITLAAVTVLSLFHHQTIILLLPFVVTVILTKKKDFLRNLKPIFLSGFISSIVPILLLLWLNTHKSPVSWHFEPSVIGLYKTLGRRELSGYLVTTGEMRGMYLLDFNPAEIIGQIPQIITIYINHFSLIPILLFFYGWWIIFKLDRTLFRLLSLLGVFVILFIPLYVKFSPDLSVQSLRERMYLLSQTLIPLLIAPGLLVIAKKLNSKSYYLFFFFIIILFSLRISSLYPKVDLSKFDLISRHYQGILEDQPQGALMACMGDISCFALLYSQVIEGVRRDVIILPHGSSIVKEKINSIPDLKGYDYSQDPEQYLDYITWNIGKRPVTTIDLQKIYYDLLGIDYGFLLYNPRGYYGEFSQHLDASYEPDYQFSRELADKHFLSYDIMRQQLKASVAQRHIFNAITYRKQDLPLEKSLHELQLAQKLVSDLPQSYQAQVNEVSQNIGSFQISLYVPNNPNPSIDEIYSQAEIYFKAQKWEQALIGYRGILTRDPLHELARTRMAQIYEILGFKDLALMEYQNVLKNHQISDTSHN